MCTSVERQGVDQYLRSADVADVYDIEQAVVDLCIRSDHHAAAEIAGVCDAKGNGLQRMFRTVVKPDADEGRVEIEHFLERGYCEISPAAN